jgi:hypothetical protein
MPLAFSSGVSFVVTLIILKNGITTEGKTNVPSIMFSYLFLNGFDVGLPVGGKYSCTPWRGSNAPTPLRTL